ncbi:MAG: histidine kinase [Pyrinomonadaceae bacterium]|nr:histidine kinase [Blastocatellia bacterium]MCW5955900.1 histidine kinase [Pyrinomonadaceae bacterium]
MNRLRKYVKPFLILLAIWTVVGLMFAGASFLSAMTENRQQGTSAVLLMSLLRSYIWGIFSPVIYIVAKRFPVTVRTKRYKNIGINAVTGLAVSAVYAGGLVAFAWSMVSEPSPQSATYAVILQRWSVSAIYTLFSLYTPTFFSILAILILKDYRNEEAKNVSLQAELSNAQLNALKMQLHPHFLFNSLHSISSLILLDPKRANEMVALLGDFLRQTLEHSNDQIVTLSEELEFLRPYLEIEKTRFEDRLTVEINIEPETLDALVPHLIVQPILENAVKHGISPFAEEGRIEILSSRTDGRLILCIKNSRNTEAAGTETNGRGIGLANVRTRLESIYGNAASLSIEDEKDEDYKVEMSFPFLTTREGAES